MSDDLVRRFRNGFVSIGCALEAATAIERLTSERDSFRNMAQFNKIELSAAIARAEKAENERDALWKKTQVSVTVGSGLRVYGTVEAIGRVQDYILLDSTHPIEKEDVRRMLAKALQKTEADLAEANALLKRARFAIAGAYQNIAQELISDIDATLLKARDEAAE